jgi:hypothetical protein
MQKNKNMKKYFRTLLATLIIFTGVMCAQVSTAQPPSPPSSGDGGGSNTPMGGAAPIDGGMIILLAAGAAYGAKKVYNAKHSRKETI